MNRGASSADIGAVSATFAGGEGVFAALSLSARPPTVTGLALRPELALQQVLTATGAERPPPNPRPVGRVSAPQQEGSGPPAPLTSDLPGKSPRRLPWQRDGRPGRGQGSASYGAV